MHCFILFYFILFCFPFFSFLFFSFLYFSFLFFSFLFFSFLIFSPLFFSFLLLYSPLILFLSFFLFSFFLHEGTRPAKLKSTSVFRGKQKLMTAVLFSFSAGLPGKGFRLTSPKSVCVGDLHCIKVYMTGFFSPQCTDNNSKKKTSAAIFVPRVLMYQKRKISLPVGYKTARLKVMIVTSF